MLWVALVIVTIFLIPFEVLIILGLVTAGLLLLAVLIGAFGFKIILGFLLYFIFIGFPTKAKT